MYHAIVKHIARSVFEDLSGRKVEPLIEWSASDFNLLTKRQQKNDCYHQEDRLESFLSV